MDGEEDILSLFFFIDRRIGAHTAGNATQHHSKISISAFPLSGGWSPPRGGINKRRWHERQLRVQRPSIDN